MELYDAIYQRRSVRAFTDETVPRDVLERIVLTGIEAPSGCNAQLRQYLLVDDPEIMDRVRPFNGILKTAPAMIVVLMDPKPTPYGEFWVQDASAAMQNMLLAATAEGYGAVWIEGALRSCEEELRQALGVPEGLRVWSLMPVGRPSANPGRPEKSLASQVVHVNRFGQRL